MASFYIRNLNELDWFASRMAQALATLDAYPAILLKGPLGAGKTAFTAALVARLPDGDMCEVASPSFNVHNIYPCRPAIFHFDLYRCKTAIPEELREALEDASVLSMIEWAEYLPKKLNPANFLDIHFNLKDNTRLLELQAYGSLADSLLAALASPQAQGPAAGQAMACGQTLHSHQFMPLFQNHPEA